jgi:2-iminoacetate synthase ThiH
LDRHLVDAQFLSSEFVTVVFSYICLNDCRRFCTFTHNGHGTVTTA